MPQYFRKFDREHGTLNVASDDSHCNLEMLLAHVGDHAVSHRDARAHLDRISLHSAKAVAAQAWRNMRDELGFSG